MKIGSSNRWFFTADLHLEHSNIIKYCRRPFMTREEEGLLGMIDRGTIPARELRISKESTDRMTTAIIDNINAVVGRDDTLVINGDFCWTSSQDRFESAKRLRDRINCRNIFLINGNHDPRDVLTPLFTACYDQYLFNVGGQYVFASHYPCRSWDRSHRGSISVYGHVHANLSLEDNGKLLPYDQKIYSEGFASVLKKYGIVDSIDPIINELLAVTESTKGIDLTVDVGVDNLRKGMPFGTPWSMEEIREHMDQKMELWNKRQETINSF